jgi:TP901 family phage tail tape measure protein
MPIGSLIYRVGADIEGFERAFGKVSKQLNKARRDSTRALSGFRNLGSELSNVGLRFSAISAGIVGVGVAATKFATDFNRDMANVATLIPDSTERINELKTAVQDMAVDVGKRTDDLARGLFQVISAFGDTADTVKILEINAKAAAAGLASTEEAIALTSAVTKGYGEVSAETVQQVADLAFETNRLGQTTFPELAASMGRVVPIAATLGVNIEELFAGFATLTGVTGNASEVSTQLSAVLRAMIKPTEAMSSAVEKLGFNSAQSMVQQLGMTEALRALIGTTDGTTESVAKLFGRAESLTAVFALTGGQADNFNSKLAAMRDVSGAADQAFRQQTEGVNKLGFTMSQLRSKLDVAAQRFGDFLAPALLRVTESALPLVDQFGRLIKWFSDLPKPVQTGAIAIAGLAAALGPLLLVGGQTVQMLTGMHVAGATLVKVLPVLTAKIAASGGLILALKGLLAVLAGPAGLVALLGVGLVAAAIAVKKNFIEMDDVIKKHRRTVEQTARAADRAMEEEAAESWRLHDAFRELAKQAEERGIAIEKGHPITQEAISDLRELVRAHDAEIDAQRRATAERDRAMNSLEGIKRIYVDFSADLNRFSTVALLNARAAMKSMTEDMSDLSDETIEGQIAHQAVIDILDKYPAAQEKMVPPPMVMSRTKQALDKTHDLWDDFGTKVSTSITNASQSMIGILIGTESGSVGDAFKRLGQGILSSFVEPAMQALNQLIDQGIKKLIGWLIGDSGLSGALGGIGGLFGKIFGAGGGVAGGAAGGAGGAAGGAAGAGGGVAGGVIGGASGLVGTLGMVGAIGRTRSRRRA